MLHAAAAKIREDLTAHPQILVVCTGNICRSPMGEVVLREKLAGSGPEPTAFGKPVTVASCGVSAEEHGKPIYPPAARTLEKYGYPVPRRKAHQATAQELRESGLIVAMTSGHARSLQTMCLEYGVPLRRIHLWREFDSIELAPSPDGCFGPGGSLTASSSEKSDNYSDFYSFDGEWDVPDPWYSGDFEETFAVVESGAAGIAAFCHENV